jgi:hypothetical protein
MASDQVLEHDEQCAPYSLRVEAAAGVDPATGTMTVECRAGFVRQGASFGALDSSSAVSVTRTEATPTEYTIDYTMMNVLSGGIYLQTECVLAPRAGPAGPDLPLKLPAQS